MNKYSAVGRYNNVARPYVSQVLSDPCSSFDRLFTLAILQINNKKVNEV